MLVVRPFAITESVLVASDVPEAETQWNAGTTYAAGAIVRGTGLNAHQLYASAQASNLNHAVTDAAWWTPYAATNRWSMFDGSIGRQTTNTGSITVQLQVTGRIDTIAFQNVDAESITIQAYTADSPPITIYDETYSMVSDSGINDWWSYFTEEIVRIADLTVIDFPGLYANPSINILISDPGQPVACGECIVGLSRNVGGTSWSPTVGIQDYSTKEADAFGGFNVVERAYAKRATFQVKVPGPTVDVLQDLLASLRATPAFYIGDPSYTSTHIYGYFRDFNIDIAYPDISLCSLEIEGLA